MFRVLGATFPARWVTDGGDGEGPVPVRWRRGPAQYIVADAPEPRTGTARVRRGIGRGGDLGEGAWRGPSWPPGEGGSGGPTGR